MTKQINIEICWQVQPNGDVIAWGRALGGDVIERRYDRRLFATPWRGLWILVLNMAHQVHGVGRCCQ
jgi:hypothetical protein